MTNDERAICDAALASIRDAECDICDVVSKRIHHEMSNFNRLVAGWQYDSDRYLKLADTQYSFEQLREAMNYLSCVQEFHHEATELLRLAEKELSRPPEVREAKMILAIIEKLEPRVKRRHMTRKIKQADLDSQSSRQH